MRSYSNEPESVRTGTIRAISDFLARNGFKVVADYTVDGLSGYKHHFHLYAQRGEIRILIDVPRDVFELLASLAKRIDVRGFDFLIVVEKRLVQDILPEVAVPEGEVLERATFIVFDGIEDMLNRLQHYLTAKASQGE
ncbi:MAG: hypothetical protein QXO64_04870 [Thermofilaceae archaeon]